MTFGNTSQPVSLSTGVTARRYANVWEFSNGISGTQNGNILSLSNGVTIYFLTAPPSVSYQTPVPNGQTQFAEGYREGYAIGSVIGDAIGRAIVKHKTKKHTDTPISTTVSKTPCHDYVAMVQARWNDPHIVDDPQIQTLSKACVPGVTQ